MSFCARILLFFICGVALSCSEERQTRRPSGCTTGRSIACTCAGGASGIQRCQSDHTFAPCQCEGFDGGPNSDASTDPDANTNPDAAPFDLGFDAGVLDTGVVIDSGMIDTGVIDTGLHEDVGFPDAVVLDLGPPDLGFVDTGVVDTGVVDAGVVDTGVGDAGVIQDAGTISCTNNSQCPSGRCHPLYQQCVPVGKKLGCEVCTNDDECGMASDHCLDIFSGNDYLETICARACNWDHDCPRGYNCSVNNHCYPIPGTIRVHTCASFRDMFLGSSCDPTNGIDECGVPNFDDGTCVPLIGCTVGCDTANDCPEGSTCTDWIVADYCTP